jgi:hypothetical protein
MLAVHQAVKSTDVVLVARNCHSRLDVTVVGDKPRLFVQLLNVGGAAVPAEFVVVASVPEALTRRVTVHDTCAEPEVSVTVPWP